jgi:FKBP-type peptidyl-prolyl cis-trans isomerase
MKIVKMLPIAVLFVLAACESQSSGSSAEAAADVSLESHSQRISYLLGLDNGKNIRGIGLEIDAEAFNSGFVDGLDDKSPALSEEMIAETIQRFETEMTAKRDEMQQADQQAMAMQSEGNLKEGVEFLAANGAAEGVMTTESGLQYKVITAGTGATPTADSVVEVHYAGRLLDGTEFDSSIKRGVPAQFGVTQVIAGWTEALQLMSEGAKWELYIPADLAYGPGGTGPIGPNQTLIFEVELLNANVGSEG